MTYNQLPSYHPIHHPWNYEKAFKAFQGQVIFKNVKNCPTILVGRQVS